MLLAPAHLAAQERGAAALANALDLLRHDVPRVLYVAAHPDDEDTQLITWLQRGGYAEVAYLSLNRGDGGQNLIGDELGEALGVLRTQELLAARRVDGAHQFFTRAYDFGFSKSAAETYTHWPHDSLLNDVVRIVRAFRPHVIVTTFSGTPRDGHGQHQVSALLAREAYEVAGDTVRFPVRRGGAFGAPWEPLKLYRLARFSPEAATVRMNVGEFEPLAGRSFAEIAAESRSQHKSQGFGTLQRRGVIWDMFRREASRVNESTPPEQERSLFDGLEGVTLPPPVGERAWRVAFTGGTVEDRRAALAQVASFTPRDGNTLRRANRAAVLAASVELEAIAARELVALGDSVQVTFSLYNRGVVPVTGVGGPALPGEARVLPDSVYSWRGFFRGAEVSEPWWLAAENRTSETRGRQSDIFDSPVSRIPEDELERAEWARVRFRIEGIERPRPFEVQAPYVFRFADPVRGEVQRPVAVVPGVTITPARHSVVVPAASPLSIELPVTLRSAFAANVEVALVAHAPGGVVAESPSELSLVAGRVRSVPLRISGSLPPGQHRLELRAAHGDSVYSRSVQTIDYDHIAPQRLYRPADVSITAVDVAIPAGLRVGYLPGVADVGVSVLRDLGIDVTQLRAEELPSVDLSRFTTMVVGPRAYEATPELLEHNQLLLDYVARGGRLVVQYGQYEMMRPGVMPYPIVIPRPHGRVTDETAPVIITDSTARELRWPNRITAADFAGWVQERALYMPREIDSRYAAPLAMSDPGEPLNRGAILVAPVGEGTYVYTTLALFRQLRAGVPGAVRLFVNLLVPAER